MYLNQSRIIGDVVCLEPVSFRFYSCRLYVRHGPVFHFYSFLTHSEKEGACVAPAGTEV